MGKLCAVIGAVALWPIVILLSPGLLTLFLVLLGSQLFVTRVLRPLFRAGDLVQPLEGRDVAFCTDNFWTQPTAAIGSVHLLRGWLDPEALQRRISSVLTAEEGAYRRLTSVYPEFWLGYPFWKAVEPGSFQLSNHFRVLAQPAAPPDLNALITEWVRSPFREGTPLWDVLFLPGWAGGSIFCLRMHHSVGDGYSILQFLNRISDSPSPKVLAKAEGLGRGTRLLSSANVAFWMPYSTVQFCRAFFLHTDYFSKRKSSQPLNFGSTKMSLSSLKGVKVAMSQKLGRPVSFLNVLMHLVGSSLRKFLVEHRKEVRLPGEIFISTALPILTEPHPEETFCNHWTYGTFRIPISDPNSLSRLRRLQSYSDLQFWIQAPQIYSHFASLCSILPRPFLQQFMGTVTGTSLSLSNIPGPTRELVFCGIPAEAELPVIGLALKHASIAIGVLSYNGGLCIDMLAHQDVVPSSELNMRILNDYLQEEVSGWLGGSSEDSIV